MWFGIKKYLEVNCGFRKDILLINIFVLCILIGVLLDRL